MKKVRILLLYLLAISLNAQPGGVNGIALWLQADAGVNGGASIFQWNDQSGYHRHAVQNIANKRPTYNAVDVNFNPSFHYTNHFLDVPYHAILNGNDLMVLAVVNFDKGSSYHSPWTTRDDYPQRGHILYYQNNRYRYWNGQGGGWSQLTTADSTKNYEIITAYARDASTATQSKIEKKFYLQGRKRGQTVTRNFSPNTRRPFRIGKGATEKANGNYPWNGDIAEIIVYPSALSDTDRNRIESYLAIKYGITLYQDSGTTYTNYRDSFGSVIWSQSINDLYRNNIAGLGKDSASSLEQKISKSINPQAIITMATSSDFLLSNRDTSRPSLSRTDRSFLIWANRNRTGTWVSSGAPSGGKILNRKWKVQKSGAPNNISLQVDVDDQDFDLDPFSGKLYFVKGNDLSTTELLPMTDDGIGKWHIDNIDFSDGDFFSFVINPKLPDIQINKTSIVIADGVNVEHSKRIPGATIRYCFTVDNTGEGNADSIKIEDTLTGKAKDNLIYVKAGSMIQDISAICDCTSSAMDDTKGSISGTNIIIDIGTLSGKNASKTSRSCAYMEMRIK